ncbi:MAG: NUDIX hydrolase [Parcubacteria group bacterium]|nr:NUDIX hydrolase [Parcubacteria group bacterium]
MLPPEEYYKSLPRKRIGAGVLFFDEKDRVLLVKPNYKEGWIIPGGSVDEHESPQAAAVRETKEELNIDLKDPKLICVSFAQEHGIKTEALHFIFSGGVLSKEQIARIRLQKEELDEFKFVSIAEAKEILAVGLKERLSECLENYKTGQVIYFET